MGRRKEQHTTDYTRGKKWLHRFISKSWKVCEQEGVMGAHTWGGGGSLWKDWHTDWRRAGDAY